jgi:transposase
MRRGGEEPLRVLSDAEREQVAAIVRARSERGDLRQRAVALAAVALAAVAEGLSVASAARRAGYTKGYTVTRLVRRFNARGLEALEIAPGRGAKRRIRRRTANRSSRCCSSRRSGKRTRSRTSARPGR